MIPTLGLLSRNSTVNRFLQCAIMRRAEAGVSHFIPPRSTAPHNNEVTDLNVSRTGNHGEWGAKNQVARLVIAKKGRGNSECGR